ncbi:MAG: carboxymuconolactone decarboxylase family protein [Pseudomonadales bacterium]|jgi:alkylhydroperoxidase family enzyme|nr:carboxymuconolactone decarboxylase family protein [Pseudomonadales bacterium]
MRVSTPRIPPVEREALDEDAAALMARFGDEEPLNIFRTLAHHPALLRRWLVFANHVLGKSTLPERERELLILRIGWLCRAGYEWGQHVLIGLESGLTAEEIQQIKAGPDAGSWSDADRDLLCAVDELHRDAHLSDATWARLAARWSEQQLMDIVFTVGQYNLVSMALNSFGVQPEPGLPRLSD